MQMFVHCADISNPVKPAKFAGRWSDRVMEGKAAWGVGWVVGTVD